MALVSQIMLNWISILFVCMAKLVIFKEAVGQIDQLPPTPLAWHAVYRHAGPEGCHRRWPRTILNKIYKWGQANVWVSATSSTTSWEKTHVNVMKISLKVERLFAQTLAQKSVSLVVKTLSEVVCSRVPVRWLTTGSCPWIFNKISKSSQARWRCLVGQILACGAYVGHPCVKWLWLCGEFLGRGSWKGVHCPACNSRFGRLLNC